MTLNSDLDRTSQRLYAEHCITLNAKSRSPGSSLNQGATEAAEPVLNREAGSIGDTSRTQD
jgi:hypothetical protein